MNLVTSKFRETIEQLINELKPGDFIDAEEKRLAADFQALPLGISLWSYAFLTSDGELIETEWEPNEISRSKSIQAFAFAVAIAARRFPQLETFIPIQPENSIVCPACQGTKLFGEDIVTGKRGKCPACAALGWRYSSE